MPNWIAFGLLNVNSPQQNAGVFVGQVNMTGWDANQKLNIGHGGMFGIMNYSWANVCFNVDGWELADGNILDQDWKAQIAGAL
ncbi:MAG: hypothetical protein K6T31_06725 [Alicyclobacillus sp.]|nr:hypothetical protein [Alicyclobacillus sp.]